MGDIIAALRLELGADQVLTGAEIGTRYRGDMSGTGTTLPLALIRPRAVAEIATALRLANEAGIAMVPQGGLTGLAGGANPGAGAIALSLERWSGVEEVDAQAGTMTVRAGTPLETAQEAAASAGFLLPLDLGSRGSAQVGGNVATNAGGNRVIRYGMARALVLGLEVVLADGTVLTNLNKMLKNNAGFDLKQLFIGSEGTLGIITRIVFRLRPLPRSTSTAFCAAPDYPSILELLRRAEGELGGPSAFEVMWPDFYRFVTAHPTTKSQPLPPDHGLYVLIEHQGNDAAADPERFETFLGGALEDGLIADAVIARNEKEVQDFWRVREGLALDTLPHLVNFDVSLPMGRIDDFAAACRQKLLARWPAGPESHAAFFGHIGDSNLHICVSVPYRAGEGMHDVDELVYATVRDFEGSVSAEHGIGTLKRDYLGHSRSPAEIAVMRRLKAALDPRGILNPGKVI
ncbi:FAD/FMN-containing dehydrogenase [Dongia mobilis]|uniref:FAD/FMN-containing dehydrogenase n=1 Tax=Dongia mobilis TaxID=578943 RepID=A0A4V3DEY6_9PROT|nr:FAD-binding oxidoreductase [Dongia mobilis]TDQ83901.1 FAD/FMN-containing dehydrogenase [Dongia mobilis]